MKTFHPLDDWYGQSPMEAAACAIDIHNAGGAWNKALIDNSARPSGALVFANGGRATEEQFARLRAPTSRHDPWRRACGSSMARAPMKSARRPHVRKMRQAKA
jgi:phage portal protein BeeE